MRSVRNKVGRKKEEENWDDGRFSQLPHPSHRFHSFFHVSPTLLPLSLFHPPIWARWWEWMLMQGVSDPMMLTGRWRRRRGWRQSCLTSSPCENATERQKHWDTPRFRVDQSLSQGIAREQSPHHHHILETFGTNQKLHCGFVAMGYADKDVEKCQTSLFRGNKTRLPFRSEGRHGVYAPSWIFSSLLIHICSVYWF